MNPQYISTLYDISTKVIPLILAITLHEAAHAYAAQRLGDDTAARLGRVSFNPIRHIDLFGTILLPAMLWFARAPFLFGYALPVPVNFAALRHPRRDMALVAAAGPAMNLLLATLAALSLHVVTYLPVDFALWFWLNLKNALIINVVLAMFNLVPLPPLDGGRIAVGVLPKALAIPLAHLERYGMLILIALLLVVPLVGDRLGVDLNVVWRAVATAANAVIEFILQLTGNS
jgi:Zn-dependent protease